VIAKLDRWANHALSDYRLSGCTSHRLLQPWRLGPHCRPDFRLYGGPFSPIEVKSGLEAGRKSILAKISYYDAQQVDFDTPPIRSYSTHLNCLGSAEEAGLHINR
jgi:hypothetical protein